MAGTFLYFAYGSNLLAKRIHINNPTALRRGVGRLENFRLDFIRYSQRWGGASATIVPCSNSHVWGAIWEIGAENLKDLDHQEGVHNNVYFPLEVDVKNPDGEIIRCRVYQQCKNPTEHIEVHELPEERRPSLVYVNTIIKGAEQSGIPSIYIKFLKSIKHNNYEGEVEMSRALR